MIEGSRVLITGIGGFAGRHLAERLCERAEVWGLDLAAYLGNVSNLKGVKPLKCDLLDYESTAGVLKRVAPQHIFHLAAQSAPSVSLANPGETLKVNIFSTLNLFEAVLKTVPEAFVLNVGSGDEYGNNVDAAELPVKETAEFKPTNPYAVSKITTDMLAFQYWQAKALNIIRCRPFNHLGPGQSALFVAPDFARQIAEIEAGLKEEKVLRTGNLDVSKDFLDVRDVVRAYEFLMDKGRPGDVYNICSGRAIKIRDILDTLLSFSGEKIEVAADPSKFRPGGASVVYGDCSKLKALGWAPEHRLEDGLKALLEYWRKKVKGEQKP